MIDPLWSDEQIAAWTSTHDRLTWRDSPSGGGLESVIPTAAVTALLRALRDETAQRMAALEDKVRACSEKYSAEWHNAAALEAQVVALEAQHAALVEAAERMLDWRASPILEGETLEDAERWAKVLYGELRAALDAAKGE